MLRRLVLVLLALSAIAPASAEAKHSSCAARHSVTLDANDAYWKRGGVAETAGI